MKPAESLLGITLEGGWTVVEQVTRGVDATGGNFSFGYKVADDSGNPQLSIEFADQGLKANPSHPILRNNKAVALATQGKVDEAMKVFEEIAPASPTDIFLHATLLATEGLLNFRAKRLQAGRDLYAQAAEAASNNPQLKAMALLHWAKEEFF